MTDRPRRLKPVDIYYHFYSASKEASIRALQKVYDWAIGERLFSIYTSEYVDKVLDFNRTVVARDGGGWLIRNSGQLREMRIPKALGFPNLVESASVSGFNDHGDNRYLHLAPGDSARVQLQSTVPKIPYLIAAGGYLDSLKREAHGLRLTLTGHTPFTVRLGNTAGCRIENNGKFLRKSSNNELAIDLTEGKHALAIDCP
jgi:hypothetical protein